MSGRARGRSSGAATVDESRERVRSAHRAPADSRSTGQVPAGRGTVRRWIAARRAADRAPRRDEGSAVVEFVVLAVLLLVPVVYLVVTLGRLQAAAFATDGGARAAARAFVTAQDEATGSARARTAVRLALLDQGFDAVGAEDATVALDCAPRPCLTPGGRVSVTVSVDVLLPLVPSALDAVVPARVTVRSRQVAPVDAFRAAP